VGQLGEEVFVLVFVGAGELLDLALVLRYLLTGVDLKLVLKL
jgi:hypothetical protein